MNVNTVRSQMAVAGFAILTILAVVAGIGTYGIRNGSNALAQVFERRVEPMRLALDLDRDVKEVRFRMAGVLLDQLPTVGSRNHLAEARRAIAANWTGFKAVADLRDEESKKRVERIDKTIDALPAFFDKLDRAYQDEDRRAITSMLEDEWPAFHAGLVKPLEGLLPLQQAAAKETYTESRAVGDWLIVIGACVAALGLVLTGGIGYFLMRKIHSGVLVIKTALAEVAAGDLGKRVASEHKNEFGEMASSLDATTQKLAEVAGGVRDMANQSAALADELAGKMREAIERGQARNAAIMAVGAAIEQMSTATGAIAGAAAAAADAARHSEQTALAGNGNMAKSMDAAADVAQATDGAAAKVAQLNDSIQKIGQIAVVIKDIADQTNLLALNAAIEAARAGESGRGFAVVADEVRKLAERTTNSTSEIAALLDTVRGEAGEAVGIIEDVRRRVDESATFSRTTGEMLNSIVAAASGNSERIGEIAHSVREQSAATEDVSKQIADIADLTERNAAALHGADEIAQHLSTVSTGLRELVSYFRSEQR